MRGDSSLEVANKPAWSGSVCRYRRGGGGGWQSWKEVPFLPAEDK